MVQFSFEKKDGKVIAISPEELIQEVRILRERLFLLEYGVGKMKEEAFSNNSNRREVLCMKNQAQRYYEMFETAKKKTPSIFDENQ